MDELRKINEMVAIKQLGRFAGGIGSMIFGLVLLGKFTYQLGITDCQKNICEEFPEEYNAILEKIVKSFENN